MHRKPFICFEIILSIKIVINWFSIRWERELWLHGASWIRRLAWQAASKAFCSATTRVGLCWLPYNGARLRQLNIKMTWTFLVDWAALNYSSTEGAITRDLSTYARSAQVALVSSEDRQNAAQEKTIR